ncbi:MAG: DUF6285 domain-containing protein [Solirubrobacteraceae bacterium]
MSDHEPTPGELVGAVIEFLATTVRPALTGHARFESLIAIRLLQIAAGDYERGAEMRARERERLARLLGHAGDLDALEAELVERIRAGALSGEDRAAVLDALRASARDQLEIANPGYLRGS